MQRKYEVTKFSIDRVRDFYARFNKVPSFYGSGGSTVSFLPRQCVGYILLDSLHILGQCTHSPALEVALSNSSVICPKNAREINGILIPGFFYIELGDTVGVTYTASNADLQDAALAPILLKMKELGLVPLMNEFENLLLYPGGSQASLDVRNRFHYPLANGNNDLLTQDNLLEWINCIDACADAFFLRPRNAQVKPSNDEFQNEIDTLLNDFKLALHSFAAAITRPVTPPTARSTFFRQNDNDNDDDTYELPKPNKP